MTIENEMNVSVTQTLFGLTEYRIGGNLHRPNGPAIVWHDRWAWCLYNLPHRYYGPQHSQSPDWMIRDVEFKK